jgi:hypothetical protein
MPARPMFQIDCLLENLVDDMHFTLIPHPTLISYISNIPQLNFELDRPAPFETNLEYGLISEDRFLCW